MSPRIRTPSNHRPLGATDCSSYRWILRPFIPRTFPIPLIPCLSAPAGHNASIHHSHRGLGLTGWSACNARLPPGASQLHSFVSSGATLLGYGPLFVIRYTNQDAVPPQTTENMPFQWLKLSQRRTKSINQEIALRSLRPPIVGKCFAMNFRDLPVHLSQAGRTHPFMHEVAK